MVTWSEMRQCPCTGGGVVAVKTAVVPNHEGRFHIYRSGGEAMPTIWTLYDEFRGGQYVLQAGSWRDCERVAADTIRRLLLTEVPVAEA